MTIYTTYQQIYEICFILFYEWEQKSISIVNNWSSLPLELQLPSTIMSTTDSYSMGRLNAHFHVDKTSKFDRLFVFANFANTGNLFSLLLPLHTAYLFPLSILMYKAKYMLPT